MSPLPLIHITLYKHGVGYFRRRGIVVGESLKLTFKRDEMDDILKSLTVIDHKGGTVRGIDYDTPQNKAEKLAGCSIILDETQSLQDLLIALRGREVRLLKHTGDEEMGTIVGLDETSEDKLLNTLVSLLRADTGTVIVLPLSEISGVELYENAAADDLRFFLETTLGQESHRSIELRLSPGEHDLELSYIAPAPTWRISYRLVTDGFTDTADTNMETKALLQGWGIFDNRMEEDVKNISLSLTAGMPISFMYDLYTPQIPQRPIIEPENRLIPGAIDFESPMALEETNSRLTAPFDARPMPKLASRASFADSAPSQASGKAMGELFQYQVTNPVSVGRGQSAMVPVITETLQVKKDLIYNGQKMPIHPIATIRFKNTSDLTLEHGPVTVLDQGEYVGEAILPFTSTQGEVVIAYAVELGLHINERVHKSNHLQSLHIKDGFLVKQYYDVKQTIYKIDNRTAQSKQVLIEHPASQYTIYETPDPVEKTLESYRYRVSAEPGQLTSFTIQERLMQSTNEVLLKQTYAGLQKYLQDKFLDEATYSALKGLLDIQAEITALQEHIKVNEAEINAIYTAQSQIQKNMSTLGQSGEEGKLRGRYVKQLTQHEENLAQISTHIAQHQQKIKELEAKFKATIKNLSQ